MKSAKARAFDSFARPLKPLKPLNQLRPLSLLNLPTLVVSLDVPVLGAYYRGIIDAFRAN
jgi:hypothetical protein